MISFMECHTPEDIEAQSFAIIDTEIPEPRPFSGAAWQVARRLIHTSGDTSLVDVLRLPDEAVQVGVEAIRRGAQIFTDTEMVKAGIPMRRLLPFGVSVSCILAQPGIAEKAKQQGMTRSRMGIEMLGNKLGGNIVVIGNAPTALLALIEYVAAGGTPPALVVGMPVGFVNAQESKDLLLQTKSLPSLVIAGRRGGSPLAAATINALACLAITK